jgi:glyoxylase-like metal-dependent hydrolase (beta-lactamase superfamily II)
MTLKIHIIPVTPFEQNCSFLVCDETRKVSIVDPGGDLEKIIEAINSFGLKPEQILITHGHVDHCSGAAELAEKLKIPILGPHIDDQFWIELLPEQAKRFGFTHQGRNFTPSKWLNDGDTVKVGNQTLEVIHCPGHTPGHVVFVDLNSRIAAVGDVLFAGSIGRTDFPRGNHQDLIHSIKKKLIPIGDDINFIPGHGPMSTLGHEKETNPYLLEQ